MSVEDKLDILISGLGKLQTDIEDLAKRVDRVETIKKQEVATTKNRTTIKRSTQQVSSDRQTYTEPMNIIKDRPNLFVINKLDKLHKEDVAIDKLLTKGKKTVRHSPRPTNLVEVECRVCHCIEYVNASLIPMDKERYKCNKCIGKQ